jgi:hypothetical protein
MNWYKIAQLSRNKYEDDYINYAVELASKYHQECLNKISNSNEDYVIKPTITSKDMDQNELLNLAKSLYNIEVSHHTNTFIEEITLLIKTIPDIFFDKILESIKNLKNIKAGHPSIVDLNNLINTIQKNDIMDLYECIRFISDNLKYIYYFKKLENADINNIQNNNEFINDVIKSVQAYLLKTFNYPIEQNIDLNSLLKKCINIKNKYDNMSRFDYKLDLNNMSIEEYDKLYNDIKGSVEKKDYSIFNKSNFLTFMYLSTENTARFSAEIYVENEEKIKEIDFMNNLNIYMNKAKEKFANNYQINIQNFLKKLNRTDLDEISNNFLLKGTIIKQLKTLNDIDLYYNTAINSDVKLDPEINKIFNDDIYTTQYLFMSNLPDNVSYVGFKQGLEKLGIPDFEEPILSYSIENFKERLDYKNILNKIKNIIEDIINNHLDGNKVSIENILHNGITISDKVKNKWLYQESEYFIENFIYSRALTIEPNQIMFYIKDEFGEDFLLNWLNTRMFGSRNSTLHDAMLVLIDMTMQKQPKFKEFIQKNKLINTSNDKLYKLLNPRREGIIDNKIIPGVYIDDEKEFFRYLYKNNLLTEFEENRDIGIVFKNGKYSILQYTTDDDGYDDEDIEPKVLKDNITNKNLAFALASYYQNKKFPDTVNGINSFYSESVYPNPSEEQKPFVYNLVSFYHNKYDIVNFFNKLNISKVQNIKPSIKNINNFTFKILEKNDPLGAILGDLTDCCQTINGQSSDSLLDGYNNPNSGFLTVFDNTKNVIAQSWLRLGESNNLYLDNIEAIDSYQVNKTNNNKRSKSLSEAFLDWSKQIKEEYGFNGILVGTGYSDIVFDNNLSVDLPQTIKQEFPNSYDCYTDIRNKVWKTAFNLEKSNIKYSYKRII